MLRKVLTTVILAATATACLCAKDIKGTVKDTEGKGVAGVVVSDGLNTVQTDAKGRFKMSADEDSRFVFISTPSGYISSTLGDKTLFYKEIKEDVKKYEFVVEKNSKDDTNHNVIVIADPQISERSELADLAKQADDMAEFVKGMDGDYTFGICLGDIVGWDHTIYPEYNRIMAKPGFDYRYVIGNHDMTNWGRSYETSMKNYEDMYGPAWYSFNVGNVHYIVMNDNFYVGRDYFYIGYLDERQLRWLERDLSYVPQGSRVVVSMDGDYTFGICLGDIVGWDHTIYPEYNRIMAKPGFDYRYVIGNHDMTNWGRSYETSMKNYEDMYGPAWYSFNVGNVHYIVMNDNFYVGRDYFYIGYLDERQLRWLERDLSYVPQGSRVVVSMHIQTTNDKSDRDAFQYGIIGDNLCNKPALYSMLEPYKAVILSGHSHTADFEQISENIFEINVAGFCGAWWCGEVCIDGAPAGYKIFDMDGNDMKWIYKGCGHPMDYQMKVYTGLEEYPGQVIANIWDFDPLWKVEYFEDGVKVCDMERFKAQDPLAKELYKDPSSLKRTWVYAAPTENMFKATISAEAKCLEVRVTDRFGRVYTKTISK